jgi:uncharacterized protein (TIGR01244 family)
MADRSLTSTLAPEPAAHAMPSTTTTLTRDVFEQLRDSAAQACGLLKVLANEDRFLILCQLTQGERNVGQLEAALGISQPTLSQQLGVLREEKLVETRKEGKYVYYKFASHEVATIMSTLSVLYCRDKPTVQLVMHTATFATASQIADQDLGHLAKAGFRTIICLRPDSREESARHHRLKAQAELMGMQFVYFPVEKGRVTPDQVAKFGELIDVDHGRVLAYCRGGTVSSGLYRLWTQRETD